MSVIKYDKVNHPHPGGFTGYRVDTTVGGEHICHYHKNEMAAIEENSQLRREAKAFNNWHRVHGRRFTSQIAIGLSARILREYKKSGHGESYRLNYVPVFQVSMEKNHKREFRVHVDGYQGAFRRAVHEYVRWHDLSVPLKNELLNSCPDPSLFTGYLYQRMKKRHPDITLEEIKERLNR